MTGSTSDNEKIAEELQTVVSGLVRRMRAVSPSRDVSPSQVSILKRLDRDGPATVADLARADRIRHQSVATAVAALVERGLLSRTADEHDLRRKLLTITETGRTLLSERRDAGHGHIAELIGERLNGEERRQLSDSLPLLHRLIR
ncbi:MarR family winged helix-turn-helix transcriptional regulator [Nocardia sp. NPDC059240]|uniref:MarR family winged helix-turn-helix transcriptional regulator n=1 Tax=Nocardia sp. NPDC059240 TaxID=3346786 RepID=UPI0036794E6A